MTVVVVLVADGVTMAQHRRPHLPKSVGIVLVISFRVAERIRATRSWAITQVSGGGDGKDVMKSPGLFPNHLR